MCNMKDKTAETQAQLFYDTIINDLSYPRERVLYVLSDNTASVSSDVGGCVALLQRKLNGDDTTAKPSKRGLGAATSGVSRASKKNSGAGKKKRDRRHQHPHRSRLLLVEPAKKTRRQPVGPVQVRGARAPRCSLGTGRGVMRRAWMRKAQRELSCFFESPSLRLRNRMIAILNRVLRLGCVLNLEF